VQGVKVHHQKFPYVENPGKIVENLYKVSENLSKHGAQRSLV